MSTNIEFVTDLMERSPLRRDVPAVRALRAGERFVDLLGGGREQRVGGDAARLRLR